MLRGGYRERALTVWEKCDASLDYEEARATGEVAQQKIEKRKKRT